MLRRLSSNQCSRSVLKSSPIAWGFSTKANASNSSKAAKIVPSFTTVIGLEVGRYQIACALLLFQMYNNNIELSHTMCTHTRYMLSCKDHHRNCFREHQDRLKRGHYSQTKPLMILMQLCLAHTQNWIKPLLTMLSGRLLLLEAKLLPLACLNERFLVFFLFFFSVCDVSCLFECCL